MESDDQALEEWRDARIEVIKRCLSGDYDEECQREFPVRPIIGSKGDSVMVVHAQPLDNYPRNREPRDVLKHGASTLKTLKMRRKAEMQTTVSGVALWTPDREDQLASGDLIQFVSSNLEFERVELRGLNLLNGDGVAIDLEPTNIMRELEDFGAQLLTFGHPSFYVAITVLRTRGKRISQGLPTTGGRQVLPCILEPELRLPFVKIGTSGTELGEFAHKWLRIASGQP